MIIIELIGVAASVILCVVLLAYLEHGMKLLFVERMTKKKQLKEAKKRLEQLKGRLKMLKAKREYFRRNK